MNLPPSPEKRDHILVVRYTGRGWQANCLMCRWFGESHETHEAAFTEADAHERRRGRLD